MNPNPIVARGHTNLIEDILEISCWSRVCVYGTDKDVLVSVQLPIKTL